MYEDNSAAIKIAKSDNSQSLKHVVKLSYHYIQLEVLKRNVIIVEPALVRRYTVVMCRSFVNHFSELIHSDK